MSTKIINNEDFVSKAIYKKDKRAIEIGKQAMCQDREHNPPSHIVLQPGQTMIHTCPRCNKVTVVNGVITYGL